MARRKTRRRRRRRSYKGYGNPLKIYSGYGKVKVSMGMLLPSLVGGTGAMGSTLLMRAFVPPQQKDESGNLATTDEGLPKMNPFFKFAGLIGSGIGVLASLILGPFQGWGAAAAGAVTAVATGLTAQFANMVIPEDQRHLAQYGAVVATPVRRGSRVNVMSGLGRNRGMGLIASQPKTGQPGRTGMFMQSTGVLQQANTRSWGGNNTGMGF